MNNINSIISKINKLYHESPQIHINIKSSRPKQILNNVFVVITGVYPNIFCVEEINAKYPKKYSFQYADILIGKVEIIEFRQ